ncbi:hypothetical protein H1R20_g3261, partial [Candolleomyces eurysporus]
MVDFLDLPIDLLPCVLSFVVKANHLAAAAVVDKTWNVFATPLLYERVSIYSWHKEGKVKVLQLFSTLGNHLHLAKHVRRLGTQLTGPPLLQRFILSALTEIRDFPKAILNSEGDIPELVLKGLKNCRNLHSCTWTRDGSLSSEILGALSSASELRELEFNGHSQGQYDPRMLCQFKALSKISVIMPSSAVISQLRSMFEVSGYHLRHLTVICKSSPVINDDVLESMASSLTNLEQFYVTGCPKVTERGVSAIISSSQPGLRALGLESVSPRFNISTFARHYANTEALNNLRSITLTISRSLADVEGWTKAVLHLLSSSPLERFQIYATSSDVTVQHKSTGLLESTMATFWANIVAVHGHRLRRFSVHRMPISLASIHAICSRCPNLEELFLVAEPRSLDVLPSSFSRAPKLRTIHINYPLETRSTSTDTDDEGDDAEHEDPGSVLSPSDALALVKRCGPSITQFGCNAKVWQVGRAISMEEDGTVTSDVVLLPYESPDIPEQFLVVRT